MYSNQQNFALVLYDVHLAFLGFKRDGVGAAVIDTRMAIRDRDGVIRTHK